MNRLLKHKRNNTESNTSHSGGQSAVHFFPAEKGSMGYRANQCDSRNGSVIPPHCQKCFTILETGNHKVRLAPRMPLTKKLKKLLHTYVSSITTITSSSSSLLPSSLSRCQKKLVKRYLNSCNFLVISCLVCGKSTKIKCQNRSDRVQQLLAWKPAEIESPAKEAPIKSKKKKKSKKTPDGLLESLEAKKKRPVVEDFLNLDRQNGTIGSPLVTSTPLPHQDDSGIGSSKSLKPEHSGTEKTVSKESPVFALLGHQGVREGGVKKKKKGKHKHQHLEKLLHKQKMTDNAAKSDRSKNTLASFLSELSY